MTDFNAGSGVETLIGGAGEDQFIFYEGNLQAGDVFDGAGGFDTLTLTQSHLGYPLPRDFDFRPSTLVSIEQLNFSNPITTSLNAIFSSGQFGAGLSNNLQVIGDYWTYSPSDDTISVLLSAPGAFSAANWTFTNWDDYGAFPIGTGDQIYISGSTGNDSITGASVGTNINGAAGNDTLIGGVGRDFVSGGDGDDALHGGAGNDLISGGNGDDTLTGGGGNDSLNGSYGNDTYYVDNASDVIFEAVSEGTDSVISPITWTLGADFENLTLSGATGIGGTGNALNNLMTGNAAANFLNGGLGADTLQGGLGNDVYIVDASGDVIVEAANGGTDVVRSTVTHVLATNVENLLLTGSANITGLGNTLNNTLTGNAGANVLLDGGGADTLSGAVGNDTLYGGGGADWIFGGVGQDVFVFNTALGAAHIDSVRDFSVADDTIWLENAIFTKFAATGALNAAFFRVGAAAADANDYIIYNSSTGALFYDLNGNGAGGSVQIATLSAGLALSASDFLLV